ncbi:hypothetical protein SCG7086_BN_00170 [Chlamydiales bacterium SCGC AG-110-P3]|nr:hypothetical protein SCG7086_BN_00170 [Chlamydiales bacterium SCGC AG-110-P3]
MNIFPQQDSTIDSSSAPSLAPWKWIDEAKRIFNTIVLLVKETLGISDYKITCLDVSNIDESMQRRLREFEESFDYPYGDKRFRILHGEGKEKGR